MECCTVSFAESVVTIGHDRPETAPHLEPISKARLTTLLMGCHVNARNLADHGFKEIIDMARSRPSYRLSHTGLEGAGELLIRLVHE